ncbi:MAG: DUF4920 domain-containing protein [Phycisphaerae bacterium]
MFRSRWIVCLAAVAMPLLSGCAAKYVAYGEPFKIAAGESVTLAKVLADAEQYDGRFIRVKGDVTSVCAKKGCWLRMSGGPANETVFVKFTCPVEGRLIPKEAVGHDAVVEGTLKVETMTQADARHYAEDAGKSAAEIAKIVGDQQQLRMMAPAARIYGMPK